MTKISRLKVSELKELAPKAETYEFKRSNVYLIVLSKPRIVTSTFAERQRVAMEISDRLKGKNIESLIITVDDFDEIKILKMEG
jgi:hypothetical protein